MKKRISVLMLIIVFIITGIPAFALETPGSNTLPEGFYLAVPGGEAELSVRPQEIRGEQWLFLPSSADPAALETGADLEDE